MRNKKLILKIATMIAERVEYSLYEAPRCCFDNDGKESPEDEESRYFYISLATEVVGKVKEDTR